MKKIIEFIKLIWSQRLLLKNYKIEKDPYELKAGQFSKFTKVCLKQTHQGDTFKDFVDKRLGGIATHLSNKSIENSITEFNNTCANIFHLYEEHDLDVYALAYLVNCVDKDEAAEWLKVKYTKRELINISNDVKKKFIGS